MKYIRQRTERAMKNNGSTSGKGDEKVIGDQTAYDSRFMDIKWGTHNKPPIVRVHR